MTAIEIQNLSKVYRGGFQALKDVNLTIKKGEIFALLGPNGAGKSTLIHIICGLVNATRGKVLVDGFDNVSQYKQARELIGLVPQELTTDSFETVWNTIRFSRGLFGKPSNPAFLEDLLKKLHLFEKRKNKLITLSGGMKRRVLIGKALAHEPQILFLDEPTAGVDVELRMAMWELVRDLRESGVTIILTTHYIEEAELMADRIGVINHGELIIVEEKSKLMDQLGVKELLIDLKAPLEKVPETLSEYKLELMADGQKLRYSYTPSASSNGVAELLERLNSLEIPYQDVNTKQSSLEDIFVDIVRRK